ncbi:hypothetical protein H9P43_003640 [Blastocladiella emersonii ATCC 22665]|nr:hypothetical protein H9P43_003640 [Blastocladiella emersonii ATCC 22665]
MADPSTPLVLYARSASDGGVAPALGLFPLPGEPAANSTAPVSHLCTLSSTTNDAVRVCPGTSSTAAVAAHAACLRTACPGELKALDAAVVNGTTAADPPAARLEVCALAKCRATFRDMAAGICVPLDAPALVDRGVFLPRAPEGVDAKIAAVFQQYSRAVADRILSGNADARPPDEGSFADAAALDGQRLGVCMPSFPIGAECPADLVDVETGRITNTSILLRPPLPFPAQKTWTVPTAPAAALTLVRLPSSAAQRSAFARPANVYSLTVCGQQTGALPLMLTSSDDAASGTEDVERAMIASSPAAGRILGAAALPGGACTSAASCVLGACVNSRCVLASDTLSVPSPPPAPPSSPSPAPADDADLGIGNPWHTDPTWIFAAQAAGLVIAAFLLLGWSRAGIAWRTRTRRRLVRALASAQPKKSTVVRELVLDPADPRMLAAWHPDRPAARRVRYLPDGTVEVLPRGYGGCDDGTGEWVSEEPLPRYVAYGDEDEVGGDVYRARAPAPTYNAETILDRRRARRGSTASTGSSGADSAASFPPLPVPIEALVEEPATAEATVVVSATGALASPRLTDQPPRR